MTIKIFRILALLIVTFTLIAPVIAQEDDDGLLPPEALADDNGAFIDLDGSSIYYIEEGDPTAPTVILLHGFGGSTFTWRDNMPALVDAGYHVVAYDRPPFGLSEKSRDIPLSNSAQADQLAALMDALGIDSATLVGHSAGGGVISAFAVQYPERVDALVFVAGAVNLPQSESSAQASGESSIGGLFGMASNLDPDNPAVGRLIRTMLTEDRFISILESAYGPSFHVTDEVAQGYARILHVQNWDEGFLALLTNATPDEPLNADTLAEVGANVPVLLIWGEADTWVPLERGEALAALIPSATLIIYPDVGHLAMEENTATFNNDLLSFLATVYR